MDEEVKEVETIYFGIVKDYSIIAAKRMEHDRLLREAGIDQVGNWR